MVYLDFDGTIVDFWLRYHSVFCHLTNSQIELDTYKRIKQSLKRDVDVARYFGIALPADYFARKAVLLEEPEYLALDRLLLPKETLLSYMVKRDARILTARRYPENLKWQLEYLELPELVDKVICVNMPKIDWVRMNVKEKGLIVGDDIKDLKAAAVCSLQAIAVQTGLCTKEDFNREGVPYSLVESLHAFINEDK